ncbi:hypothetical protein ATANTOWER_022293, partial [Ataeniobius toweri]|nr:hypothetical protein [Ataeniobius toweri]
MAELPPQYAVQFCTGLVMSCTFDSGVNNSGVPGNRLLPARISRQVWDIAASANCSTACRPG